MTIRPEVAPRARWRRASSMISQPPAARVDQELASGAVARSPRRSGGRARRGRTARTCPSATRWRCGPARRPGRSAASAASKRRRRGGRVGQVGLDRLGAASGRRGWRRRTPLRVRPPGRGRRPRAAPGRARPAPCGSSDTSTAAPWRASSVAVAAPMPWLAPVTMATRPSRPGSTGPLTAAASPGGAGRGGASTRGASGGAGRARRAGRRRGDPRPGGISPWHPGQR